MEERAKKATVRKLAKSMAEVNKEMDDVLDLATQKLKENLSEGRVGFQSLSFAASSLKTIREERMDIRGKLSTTDKEKNKLARERMDHTKTDDKSPTKTALVFSGEDGLC